MTIGEMVEFEKTLSGNRIVTDSKDEALSHKNTQSKLSDEEMVSIFLLCTNGYSLIQDYLIKGREPSKQEKVLTDWLDSALEKLEPLVCDSKDQFLLYRSDPYSVPNWKVGEIVEVKHYLTTTLNSVFPVSKTKAMFTIHPKEKTSAKCVSPEYEIIPCMPEKQVEFPRNTKFRILNKQVVNNIVEFELEEL